MLKSLHARLALVLLGLLVASGILTVAATLVTSRLHLQEVNQAMNRDLAKNIATMKHEILVSEDGTPRSDSLQELFHWLMVVNPSLEFYLLDAEGRILAYDAPAEAVVRDRVDLKPIRRFLGGEHAPILGDDPRHLDRRKIFSVSPLPPTGDAKGYLYVILASEQSEGVVAHFKNSYILRIAIWTLLGFALLAALFGVFSFAHLTKPLRRLAARMGGLYEDQKPQGDGRTAKEGDELALLDAAFHRMTRRIERQMAEIERMSTMRRELIANVSHDLRTPIATLQGYLETLLLKKGTLGEEERDHYLRIALAQSERLGRRVAELFELTKLEHDEVELCKETFSLPELVQDNVQRFQLAAQEKDVTLDVDVETRQPFVNADIAMIDRVLENLISNAVRFTPARGKVTIALREEEERLAVDVADTGCGIAEDELPHVFDRYYRGRFNRTSTEGAGLGLAITKRILDLHGCPIQVSSLRGEGTTFSFALSRSQAEPRQELSRKFEEFVTTS